MNVDHNLLYTELKNLAFQLAAEAKKYVMLKEREVFCLVDP